MLDHFDASKLINMVFESYSSFSGLSASEDLRDVVVLRGDSFDWYLCILLGSFCFKFAGDMTQFSIHFKI